MIYSNIYDNVCGYTNYQLFTALAPEDVFSLCRLQEASLWKCIKEWSAVILRYPLVN